MDIQRIVNEGSLKHSFNHNGENIWHLVFEGTKYIVTCIEDDEEDAMKKTIRGEKMIVSEAIPILKKIVAEHQYQKIEGVIVDASSAHIILQIIPKLNEKNKAKILNMEVLDAIKLCWKLV